MSSTEAALAAHAYERPTPRNWRPSATIRGSIGLHAATLAAIAVQPATWPWALGAIAANHAALAVSGLMPRSTLLGPNVRRLSAAAAARGEIALTFDDGPDPEITPRLLDMLDAHGAKATFFVVGERARRYPQLIRETVRRGHAVENHTDTHSVHFPWHGSQRLMREIDRAQHSIADACGVTPIFFRAPMGFRTPLLEPVLARLGLHLASWTRRGFDTVERDVRTVVRRLSANLAGGDVLLLHDGVAVLAACRSSAIDCLPAVMAQMHDRGLRSITLRTAYRNASLS